MRKRWWAVLNDSDDLLGYEEAETPEEAVAKFAKGALAIPGEKVRGDVWVPRWLVDALDDPEGVLGTPDSAPEAWEAFWKGINALESRGIRLANIVGWAKVADQDFWVPVVR